MTRRKRAIFPSDLTPAVNRAIAAPVEENIHLWIFAAAACLAAPWALRPSALTGVRTSSSFDPGISRNSVSIDSDFIRLVHSGVAGDKPARLGVFRHRPRVNARRAFLLPSSLWGRTAKIWLTFLHAHDILPWFPKISTRCPDAGSSRCTHFGDFCLSRLEYGSYSQLHSLIRDFTSSQLAPGSIRVGSSQELRTVCTPDWIRMAIEWRRDKSSPVEGSEAAYTTPIATALAFFSSHLGSLNLRQDPVSLEISIIANDWPPPPSHLRNLRPTAGVFRTDEDASNASTEPTARRPRGRPRNRRPSRSRSANGGFEATCSKPGCPVFLSRLQGNLCDVDDCRYVLCDGCHPGGRDAPLLCPEHAETESSSESSSESSTISETLRSGPLSSRQVQRRIRDAVTVHDANIEASARHILRHA